MDNNDVPFLETFFLTVFDFLIVLRNLGRDQVTLMRIGLIKMGLVGLEKIPQTFQVLAQLTQNLLFAILSLFNGLDFLISGL